MSGPQDDPDTFDSSLEFGRLERSLGNPYDTILLHELLAKKYESADTTCLQAIWAFALIKGGALVQNWYQETISRDTAYLHLYANLRNSEDQTLLQNLFFHNHGRPDAALWTIWNFAAAKGRASTERWRADLEARHQRPSEKKIPFHKKLWRSLRGRYGGLVSRMRHKHWDFEATKD